MPKAKSRFDELLKNAKNKPIDWLLNRAREEINETAAIFWTAVTETAQGLWFPHTSKTPDQIKAELEKLSAMPAHRARMVVERLDIALRAFGWMRPVDGDPKANSTTAPKRRRKQKKLSDKANEAAKLAGRVGVTEVARMLKCTERNVRKHCQAVRQFLETQTTSRSVNSRRKLAKDNRSQLISGD